RLTSNLKEKTMPAQTVSPHPLAAGLKGRVSLVTGSTSGIGLGIARALGQAGSHVVLKGFGDPAEIKKTEKMLAEETGTRVLHLAADMADPGSIAHMMARVEAEFGRLDILVNNAGIQFVHPVEDYPVEKWDAILAINLSSAFHTTRLALAGM